MDSSRSSSYRSFRRRRTINNKVPAGWLDYRPLHRCVEETRLLPFKCPLRRTILRNVDIEQRFSLDDLIDRLKSQGQCLGLIIDLTDTDRYYDYRDVRDRRISYRKIRVPGHQDISDELCREFFDIVRNFLRDNQQNDKLIGIHCTHGVNRTGYFIIRYLIEICGLQPDDAIAAFGQARGYPIEKYIDDLKRRMPMIIPLSDNEYERTTTNS